MPGIFWYKTAMLVFRASVESQRLKACWLFFGLKKTKVLPKAWRVRALTPRFFSTLGSHRGGANNNTFWSTNSNPIGHRLVGFFFGYEKSSAFGIFLLSYGRFGVIT